MSTKTKLLLLALVAAFTVLFHFKPVAAQSGTTWETVASILDTQGVKITYRSDPYSLKICYARVTLPKNASLSYISDITGLSWQQLKEAGLFSQTLSSTGEVYNEFGVDPKYCNNRGGGSGGGGHLSAQYTPSYSWQLVFLVFLAAMALLAGAKTLGLSF